MLRLLRSFSAPPAQTVNRRPRRFALRAGVALSAALLAAAAGSTAPVMAHGGGGGGGTPPPPDGPLVKTVQNATSPGRIPAAHGDTLDWTVTYKGTPAPGTPATITDPISAGQTYVPGSLHVPPGWASGWSTDGSTFTGTDQGAATTAVRGTSPADTGGGTAVSGDLLPPVQAAARATGGDGFTPILFRAPDGDVEAWNIYHHTGPANPLVVCNDLSSGQPCAGGPWPRPLNTTAGPLGSGSTGDIYTTLTPQYVQDPDHPGVVYYPAVAANSVGAGCLDLGARANCGYVALESSTGSPSAANGLAGLVAAGDGKAYGVASTGEVLCLDMASHSPCTGQPFAAIVPPNHDGPGATYSLYMGAMAVADGRVYASSSPQNGVTPTSLGCYDPATGTVCAGWATPHPAAADPNAYTYNAFVSYDTAGAPNGVCTASSSGAAPVTGCFALDGGALTAPATGLGQLPGGTLVFTPEVVNAGGDNRSYFAEWGGPLPGNTTCYSWTHAAPCAGFPAAAPHPAVNGGVTRDYGYAYDATTRCLYGLGDAGILFSMDPATAGSPCLHTGASVTLTPADFYCDGSSHTAAYTQARLTGLDLGHTDPAATTVAVTDPDGTVLATPALGADGTVDLSGISAAQHPSITVTVQFSLTDTSDFAGGAHPSLSVAFQGDAPQICLKTVVGTDCAVAQVQDTAVGTDASGALTSNTVTVPVAPGAACRPHVTVVKEICGSVSPHDCKPGGPGPWVKSSPVGLLQLLGTAHWRITVANAGPVAAADVTVNDPTAPQCSSAAGSFTLAAGASRQVYCDSFLLALPVKNTAWATFVPANSPHGTPYTTTDPSSAVACSLLCILVPADKH